MKVMLKKFGSMLISRPAGNEAFKVFEPKLKNMAEGEELVLDFEDVITFSPSWGDEFLTPLVKNHEQRVFLENTANPSVLATLRTLEDANGIKFNVR